MKLQLEAAVGSYCIVYITGQPMPVTSRDLPLLLGGAEWVRTAQGWKRRPLEDIEYTPTCDRLNPRPELSITSKDVSCARNVIVTGSKGQRKVSVCLSDFLKFMHVELAVTDLQRKEYLFDMMHTLIKNLSKMSGTAHRELFKILEKICNEVLVTDFRINRVKDLLHETMTSLLDPGSGRVGSKSVWNKHIQMTDNLIIKVEQFPGYQREDDGELCLMDLPKECLREIFTRLDDHRDILRLGQTCSDLYELSQDNLMWERLTQFRFTEKQMMTFVHDFIDHTLPWQHLYRKCFKKFGVKKAYTNGLVICSACKTLHWMLQGHVCWSLDENVEPSYLEPVTPDDLVMMLNL